MVLEDTMSGSGSHTQAEITPPAEIAAPSATSLDPMDGGSRLLLIGAGGLCQTLAETLAFGRSGTIPGGTALLIFVSSLVGVLLFWLALWKGEQGPFLALKRKLAVFASSTPRWLRQ